MNRVVDLVLNMLIVLGLIFLIKLDGSWWAIVPGVIFLVGLDLKIELSKGDKE